MVAEESMTLNGTKTFTASPFITHTAASSYVYLNSDAGYSRSVVCSSGTLARWAFGATSTAETGSNAGSDFAVARYNDAGTYVDAPLLIDRASGNVALTGNLTLGGTVDGVDIANDVLVHADVDDTPVNGATNVPVSSNWAFDLVNTDLPAAYQPKGALTGINSQTGTTYTLVASDAGKMVSCSNAAAITVSVDDGVFAAHDIVHIKQAGVGQVTVSALAGMTINKPASFNATSLEQYAVITLFFDSSTEATLGGILESA